MPAMLHIAMLARNGDWSTMDTVLFGAAGFIFWTIFLYFIVFFTGAPTYKFFCPSCGKRYAHSISEVLLGPGTRLCKKCGHSFEDGSTEWAELSRSGRLRYLFPPAILVIAGLAIVCGIAGTLFTQPEDAIHLGVMGFLMFALPLLPYFLQRMYQIRKSRDRFSQRQLEVAGFRPPSAN